MNDVKLRKKPKQARSLARFEAILDHAEVIISEQGFESLKMNELARRAEVNIASIYQYFPNRTVVARAIVERYLELYRAELTLMLVDIPVNTQPPSIEVISVMLDNLLAHYYQFLQQRPTFLLVWGAVRGNPDFIKLNMQDSRSNSELMVDAMQRIGLNVQPEVLSTAAFLVCEITEPVMQALLNSDQEYAEKLLAQYRLMLSSYFQALIK